MKTLVAVLLLLVISITGNAQKLDGSWKGLMNGPDGEMELVFTFKVDVDTLSGTVSSPMGVLQIENGKINGNEFSFDVNVNGMVINHTCTLDSNVVKMSMPMMEQPMELSRVIEKSKINGKWIGTASSPQGDTEITFTFEVDGDKLLGKNSSTMGVFELTNGTVNGNEFSFDVDLQGMKIVHKCKYLDDDTIDVMAVVMDQEMPMKLKRVVQ